MPSTAASAQRAKRTLAGSLAQTVVLVSSLLLLSACGGGSGGGGSTNNTGNTSSTANTSTANNSATTTSQFGFNDNLSPLGTVGEQIFFDTALSPNGQSCATCHQTNLALTQPSQFVVPMGGLNLDKPGFRNTPTAKYAMYTPPFSLSGIAAGPGQPAIAAGLPVGGIFLDGRVDTLAEQAAKPFLSPFEMANNDSTALTIELAARPYTPLFKSIFGANILQNPDATLNAVAQAVAQLEVELSAFHSFDSKYDAFTKGQVQLTASEANGLAVFNDPSKGNCASCHTSTSSGGIPALFTDHSYRAIGVPRNWAIPFNVDSTLLTNAALYPYAPLNGSTAAAPGHVYYDLGLCGPLRTDLSANTSYCGMFKVPTLRNVAIKQRYFHNGIYINLCDVINFHLTRDLFPGHWYVKADGVTVDQTYNDMPLALTGNIKGNSLPFDKTRAPSVSNAEITDLIAFLGTLSDGFDANNPSATTPVTCQPVTH